MNEQNERNKNELEEQNMSSFPDAIQSTIPVIPITTIPKVYSRPNLTPVRTPQPGIPESPAYRFHSCDERKTVNFSVLGPIAITLDEDSKNKPGSSILDLILPAPSQIGKLVFRNFYTAWITVLVYFENGTPIQFTDKCPHQPCNKVISPLPGEAKLLSLVSNRNNLHPSITISSFNRTNFCEWIVAVPRQVLMPNSNYEEGSQDFISITASESLVILKDVKALRLVLHQPSPVWQTFYVEELNIYSDMGYNTMLQLSHIQVHQNPLLAWLRHQTMGALFNDSKIKANALSNMEIPKYEFFALPLDS